MSDFTEDSLCRRCFYWTLTACLAFAGCIFAFVLR